MTPIYLLADSQLLFWKQGGAPFLSSVREAVERESPKAAYVGASNGDNPEFYELFVAAMSTIGVDDCRMIHSDLSSAEASFLDEADIILLAGGDVEYGWSVFESNGLNKTIVTRYYEGAVLIGVSAGAVQLGLAGLSTSGEATSDNLIHTFKLVPYIIGAHEEKEEWKDLKKAIRLMGSGVQGIGIPTGGGLIYHTDHSLEPVRQPAYEFSVKGEGFSSSLLFLDARTHVTESSGEADVSGAHEV